MYRLAILLVYLRFGQTMSPITKYLLTPLDGEACGYLSCHPTVKGVLNVHIIPHTHAELGYTRTFENHFNGRDEYFEKSNINMKRILDIVISELWADNERTFVFSDLPYLYKWWTIRDGTVKRMVYQLIRQGRLQIIGGGWSMTDEATANYQAIIDHFTYSLRKLNATFLECARPTVTWQSDVFGHTNEFASLMAQMGFDGHFISPISFDDELKRMGAKRLEFIWRGSPDLGVSSEILTHKLFDGYWSPPGFCFGGQCGDPLIVDSHTAFNNVEERVKLFVEAMQYRQGPYYGSNHLVVMMGQRFGYYDAPLWFENIEKLIRNVNNYVGSNEKNMFLYYSTPACYLRALHESNVSFTVESDDFVPVAYDRNTHFSGIFTSRPSVKYAARLGNVYLQITKQLQVLTRLKDNYKFFEEFHSIMGAFQDHTILSGGLRQHVRDYYIDRMYKALEMSENIITDGFVKLMKTPKIVYKRCLFNISYCEYTNRENYHVVIYNPLAWNVTIPVRLPVNEGRFNIYLPNLKKVQSVLMKIPQCIQSIPYNRSSKYNYELVFLAEDVPGLGYRSYYIEKNNRVRRSSDQDGYFTEIREGNDESGYSNDGSINNDVKNDEIGRSGDDLLNNGVKNDEISNSVDNFHHNRVEDDKIGNSNDYSSYNGVGNDKSDYNFNYEDESKDYFTRDIVKNDDFVIKIDVNGIKDNRHDLTNRKTRSVNYNDHFIAKYDRIDDLNHRVTNYEFARLHDARNLNTKVYGSKVEPDLNIFKEPNVTRIIRFKKNTKQNDELKRIFESIDNNIDNFELDVVFQSARGKQNRNKPNKNTATFDLKESHKDLITNNKYNNEKNDKVTEHNEINLKEHTSSKTDNNTANIKNISEKTENDIDKYTKIKNSNILKGLKKCNCKNGRLKRENTEKHSEESINDTIDEIFGNKTLRFIHFKQEIINEENATNAFKHQLKDLKPEQNATNAFKHQLKDLTPEQNATNAFKREAKDVTQEQNATNAFKSELKDITQEQNATNAFKSEPKDITQEQNASNAFKSELKVRTAEQNATNAFKNQLKDFTQEQNATNAFKSEPKDLTPNQNANKPFKRETKHQKQNKDKIKELKNEIQNLKRNINNLNQHKIKESKEIIKNLLQDIEDLKHEILVITKTKNLNETRLERSLFKKIKNAKKKYLRRQTNNLKIDDESLLNNDQHYDDYDLENTTEVNEKHVTDYNDYIVTPKSKDEPITRPEETTTTKDTTTETTTTTTKKPDPVISTLYSDTTDSFISNEYINITTDIHKNVSFIALANGLTMALNINFYYFASDDPMRMGRPDFKKPGAFVFRPMDPEPVFIARKPKVEVHKSSVVEEIHFNSNFASFIIRLYKNTPYFEVQWILRGIPVSDGIGKEVFIRYKTDLETNGVFYTDANGRQTIKRVFGHRPLYKPVTPEAVAGNYYPVTSKITIEDPQKLIRFSVFNDRTQGGSSFNGEIDLMLNRRILTDDAGYQAVLNETENGIGTTVSGKHYIYITKLSTKINKIYEKKLEKEIGLKPQIFLPKKMVGKSVWKNFRNEFTGITKIPVGLNVLTLQEWNDGSFLIRLENYLEKSDVLKSGIKKVVLKDLFTVFRIVNVVETTLAGNILKKDFVPIIWRKKNGNTENKGPFKDVKVDEEILFKPQQIRTFIIWVQFHK